MALKYLVIPEGTKGLSLFLGGFNFFQCTEQVNYIMDLLFLLLELYCKSEQMPS